MKFGEIIEKYDLSDDISRPLTAELEDYFLVWCERQMDEWSKECSILGSRIKNLEKKINGKH